MMGQIQEIVFDCEEPAALAAFWSELLDGYAVRRSSDAELARIAELGLTAENAATVMLDGPGPSICFQNVDGQRPDNNRVHFDIAVSDRAGEVVRLRELGALPERVLPTYTVMRDPEGNQFCLLDRVREAAAVAA
jgi:hypothetical protein